MLRQAGRAAESAARLRARARAAGVPVIFANDNFGQWRSDLRQVLEAANMAGGIAAAITERMTPTASDYFVLKPRHSAFFGTPLALLLDDLGTRSVVLSGITTHQCVLATAIAAHVREFEVVVASDACASPDVIRHRTALAQLRNFGVDVRKSAAVCWSERTARA